MEQGRAAKRGVEKRGPVMSVTLPSANENAPVGQPAPPTRVAVVGFGYWGVNYVRVFNEMPDASLAVVCDADVDRLSEVKRRLTHVEVSDDFERILDDPTIDAVVVATPATTHFDLTKRALAAGKHVLVEKPLTTESATAAELVELSEQQGRLLMVGHTFLYNEGLRVAKQFVEHGVYYLYARRTCLGPIRNDVNAAWDLATHDVSIFNFLLDAEPQWVTAVGAKVLRHGHEDVSFITLGYPNGVVGHIHVSWADPSKVREVVIVCRDRRVVFNDMDSLERVRVFERGVERDTGPLGFGEQLLLRDGDILSPAIDAREPLKAQCGHFLHCIRRGQTLRTDARQGLAVVRVIEAVNRSMELAGAPVQLGTNGQGGGNV
jgi:predicted dehydrogenase